MFIDDVKNRYIYANTLKNVVWEQPIERVVSQDIEVFIHPEIEPVINLLTKERPTWRFKSKQMTYGDNKRFSISRFGIYDGDECLGEMWYDTHWRDEEARFYFNNFRLEDKRKRNLCNYTTKPEIAAKRIIKAFHMKTPKERAADAAVRVREIAQLEVNSTGWDLQKAKRVIESQLFAYAVTHWHTMQPLLGPDAQNVDLPKLVQTAAQAQHVSGALSNGNGVTVSVEPNGTYSVARFNSGTYDVESYTDATLPDHIRGALGLLKLVEDKTSIDGFGLRVNSGLFFVLDKKEEA